MKAGPGGPWAEGLELRGAHQGVRKFIASDTTAHATFRLAGGNAGVAAATTVWRSHTAVRAGHRGAGSLKALRYDALGEYVDDWVATPSGWRIAYRRMVMALEMGDRRVLCAEVPQ